MTLLAVSDGAPRGSERGDGRVEGSQPLVEQVWPAENLSVIDLPLVARAAAGAEAGGGGEVRHACVAKGERALDRSEHVSLLT